MRIASNDTPSRGFSKTVETPSTLLPPLSLRFDQFHIQSQALEFLDQDIEGLRESWLKEWFALHDRSVHSRTPRDIVRLDGQELLQSRSGAIGLERPDFHLANTLAAELGFPAQRLLSDQRVVSNG